MSQNIRTTFNSLSSQMHTLKNGAPASLGKTSATDRTRNNLQIRLDAIQQAITSRKNLG